MVIFCKELQRSLQSILGIIGGFLGIIVYIIKISIDYANLKNECANLKRAKIEFDNLKVDYSALKIEVKNNEKRDEEERKKNAEMFNELYNSRNKTNEVLVELASTVKNLVDNMDKKFNDQARQLEKLEQKIDDLKRTN